MNCSGFHDQRYEPLYWAFLTLALVQRMLCISLFTRSNAPLIVLYVYIKVLFKCYDLIICHTNFADLWFHKESVLTQLQIIMFCYLVLKSTMIVSNLAFLF
jgi:hypothetical protein